MRLPEDQIDFCEKFAEKNGVIALMDHLGLDVLANKMLEKQREARALLEAFDADLFFPRQP